MEYLKWHGVAIDKTWEYGSARQTVRRMFDDYLCYGGISEVFPLKDKRGWLTTLYQKVLYSDVVLRNRIRNDKALSLLVKKLADSVLQPTSVKRLQDMLTGIGEKVTRETVTAFLKYLHDAYLTFSLANYSDGIKEREGTRKHYFYDNGILNLFLFQPEAKRAGNIARHNGLSDAVLDATAFRKTCGGVRNKNFLAIRSDSCKVCHSFNLP